MSRVMSEGTPDHIEITLPLFPEATHPNSSRARGHWSVKSKAAKQQRYDAQIAALCAMNEPGAPYKPRWKYCEVQVTYYFGSNRAKPHDPDGLISWAKAAIDGLTDAELISGDRFVTWLPPRELLGKAAGGESKVVILVRTKNWQQAT